MITASVKVFKGAPAYFIDDGKPLLLEDQLPELSHDEPRPHYRLFTIPEAVQDVQQALADH